MSSLAAVTRICWSTWALTAVTPLPWGYSGISCHQGTPPSLEAGRRLYSSCSTGCVLPQDDGKEKYLFPGKLPQTILLVNLSLACSDLFWAGRAAGSLGPGHCVVPRQGLPPRGLVTGSCVVFPSVIHLPCRPARGVGAVRMLCLGQSKG